MTKDGKVRFLGCYMADQAAARAYDDAFVRLGVPWKNFPVTSCAFGAPSTETSSSTISPLALQHFCGVCGVDRHVEGQAEHQDTH